MPIGYPKFDYMFLRMDVWLPESHSDCSEWQFNADGFEYYERDIGRDAVYFHAADYL